MSVTRVFEGRAVWEAASTGRRSQLQTRLLLRTRGWWYRERAETRQAFHHSKSEHSWFSASRNREQGRIWLKFSLVGASLSATSLWGFDPCNPFVSEKFLVLQLTSVGFLEEQAGLFQQRWPCRSRLLVLPSGNLFCDLQNSFKSIKMECCWLDFH